MILTYFPRPWAPTSAANTEPMLSAAMPDADVPAATVSKSAGSGMNALREPSIAFPIVLEGRWSLVLRTIDLDREPDLGGLAKPIVPTAASASRTET